MHHKLLSMDIVEPLDQLFEQVFGILLLELSPFPDIAQEITTLAELHHEAHMPIGLEAIIEPHHIRMVALLEDSHLLHHSFLLFFFISENLFLNRLDSNEMLTDFMASQVNFSKSSPTKNPSNSIKVTSAALHIFVFLEVQPDHFLELLDVSVVFS